MSWVYKQQIELHNEHQDLAIAKQKLWAYNAQLRHVQEKHDNQLKFYIFRVLKELVANNKCIEISALLLVLV